MVDLLKSVLDWVMALALGMAITAALALMLTAVCKCLRWRK